MKELEELTVDIQEKLPRLKELPIIGLDPILNDVIEWHSKYYSKNSHFEVFNIVDNGEIYPAGVFIDYREEDPARYVWSLKETYLKNW